MLTEIVGKLGEIERSEGVRILYACESGSRAWGFVSKNSDYDVRFCYIRPVEWYLSIYPKRDILEYPVDAMWDVSGWDFPKTLQLFAKSNPTLLEWLISPIVYVDHFDVRRKLQDLMSEFFRPQSCIYHYLHMATGNFREYLHGDTVKLKKYFYILRPVLACKWIEERNAMAPMEFQILLETQVSDQRLRGAIDDLLARKSSGEELDEGPRIPAINDFLEREIARLEEHVRQVPPSSAPDASRLDGLFRETLSAVWK